MNLDKNIEKYEIDKKNKVLFIFFCVVLIVSISITGLNEKDFSKNNVLEKKTYSTNVVHNKDGQIVELLFWYWLLF